MKALVYSRFGAADCLRLEQLPAPVPTAGQALVEVVGAGLNPIDVKTRAGKGFVAQQLGEAFQFVPGYDLAGTLVEAAGEWSAGTPVIGMVNLPLGAGACAQLCAAELDELVLAPTNMTLADAAGLPLAGLTAWQGLFQHGNLDADGRNSQRRVLILAGAGGVGHLAVQLGAWAGAEVAATVSPPNHDFLCGLGATQCFDYRDPQSLAAAAPWDLILDLMGGEVGKQALPWLAAGGVMLTVPTITAAELIAAGEAQGKRVLGYTVQTNREQLQQLVALVEAGHLHLHVGQRFTLQRAVAAHQQLETGHSKGKVILEIPLGS